MSAGVAGRNHRIDHNEGAAFELRGELHEIFDRTVILVAVETDVAHACRGHQREKRIGHAEAGAQNRNDHALFPGQHRRPAVGDGRFDLFERNGEIARELVTHEERKLREKLAEVARARTLIAHQRKLMLDERMVNNMQARETRIGLHGSN